MKKNSACQTVKIRKMRSKPSFFVDVDLKLSTTRVTSTSTE